MADDPHRVTGATSVPLANLRENLKVDAEGHYVVAGPARVPVELEDAPFVVLRVAEEGDRLVATLNDLSREPLDPETLSFDREGVSPLPGERRTFAARLSRAATHQLLERMEPRGRQPGGAGGGARRYPIALPPPGTPPPSTAGA
jgi:hypothetical protein